MANTLTSSIRARAALIVLSLVVGCGTISSNTVQLSVELTNRIKDIEKSHRAFVNEYFDGEIRRVDDFMEKQWTPLFLRNFLGTSGIIADLQQTRAISESTVKELTEVAKTYLDDPSEAERMVLEITTSLNQSRTTDAQLIESVVKKFVPDTKVVPAMTHLVALLHVDTPARMIVDFAAAANHEIRARRKSLIGPIEQARKRALDELSTAYQDFYAGQGVITARLEAAVRRSAQEAKLVDSVAGEGTAAKLMGRLKDFAVDFNKVFSKIEGESGKDPNQVIDALKNKLDEALTKHGLK